jgi:hypothetical protein
VKLVKARKIFLSKEEYGELERSAKRRGLTVQGFVDAAVANIREVN